MEIYLPTGCRMPSRTASRNDGIQNPAGALGQGADPNREEDPSAGDEQQRSASHKDRSLVSPHCEHQLSAHDHVVGFALAGDDYSVLSGLVSDALHRPASIYGIDLLDFEFLSRVAEGAFPAKLA